MFKRVLLSTRRKIVAFLLSIFFLLLSACGNSPGEDRLKIKSFEEIMADMDVWVKICQEYLDQSTLAQENLENAPMDGPDELPSTEPAPKFTPLESKEVDLIAQKEFLSAIVLTMNSLEGDGREAFLDFSKTLVDKTDQDCAEALLFLVWMQYNLETAGKMKLTQNEVFGLYHQAFLERHNKPFAELREDAGIAGPGLTDLDGRKILPSEFLTQMAEEGVGVAVQLVGPGKAIKIFAAFPGLVRLGNIFYVRHHTIPREILKMLPKKGANNALVRGVRGRPNRWLMPYDEHLSIHRGRGGGAYNEFFKKRLNVLKRPATTADVNRWREEAIRSFNLRKYRPNNWRIWP